MLQFRFDKKLIKFDWKQGSADKQPRLNPDQKMFQPQAKTPVKESNLVN